MRAEEPEEAEDACAVAVAVAARCVAATGLGTRRTGAGLAVKSWDSNRTVAVEGAEMTALSFMLTIEVNGLPPRPVEDSAKALLADVWGEEADAEPTACAGRPAVAASPVETAMTALDRPTRARRPDKALVTPDRGLAAH